MESCPPVDPLAFAAFATLWKYVMKETDAPDDLMPYVLDVDELPGLRAKLQPYRQQLNGLRVLEVNDYRHETSAEAAVEGGLAANGAIDLMVYYNYGVAGTRPHIPEGVRFVAFIDGDMRETPVLPASVEMIIIQDCELLSHVHHLPAQLRSLIITHTKIDRDPMEEITIHLPASLRSLYLGGIDSFYISGPMPPCLEIAAFMGVGGSRADDPLPATLRRLDYEKMRGSDHEHYENLIELSCSRQLERIKILGGEFTLGGFPVSNLREYNAVCHARFNKKSARSARR